MASWMRGVDFLHISDIHIPDNQGDLWEGVDPCSKLEKLLEHAKRLELNPSFTVITGDISNTGTIQSYTLANQFISKIRDLGGPVFPTMGTKDNRTNFRNILLKETVLHNEPYCYYSKSIEGLHVIVMDSHTPGSHSGSFSSNQLDWLETELRDHGDIPSIIAFHEPIFFFGEEGLFKKADALRFRDIINKGNVLVVLNGHLHRPFFTVIDEVHYVQAGSPLWENSIKETWRLSYDSSSFNLLCYEENRLSVRPIGFSDETKVFRDIRET